MPQESLAKNKKAYSDYEILDTFEAGIALTGAEVKSIRAHNLNLKGSFVDFGPQGSHSGSLRGGSSSGKSQGSLRGGYPAGKNSGKNTGCKVELWVNEVHVSPYRFAHDKTLNPSRRRKLLLKKNEIVKIQKELNTKGTTCVPLEVYLKGGLIKIKIAIVRGKKQYDKRADLKKRAQNLEVARALKKKVQ